MPFGCCLPSSLFKVYMFSPLGFLSLPLDLGLIQSAVWVQFLAGSSNGLEMYVGGSAAFSADINEL